MRQHTIIRPTEPINWRQEGSERLLENRMTEPANTKPAGIAIPNNIKACKLISSSLNPILSSRCGTAFPWVRLKWP